MQDEGAGEVSAGFYSRDAGEDFLGCLGDESSMRALFVVAAAEPFLVFSGDVDWAVEGLCPVEVRGVVMGMGDLSGLDTIAAISKAIQSMWTG
jgi:dihydrodipicolinate synthase/N-acetylneuraminate lyase